MCCVRRETTSGQPTGHSGLISKAEEEEGFKVAMLQVEMNKLRWPLIA